ncbi:hypothetical protein [Escherichia coli]|uniref:hypothetical protein n=1 Tax=Escherichia coli TaxID=562 RepID=UPI003975949E
MLERSSNDSDQQCSFLPDSALAHHGADKPWRSDAMWDCLCERLPQVVVVGRIVLLVRATYTRVARTVVVAQGGVAVPVNKGPTSA